MISPGKILFGNIDVPFVGLGIYENDVVEKVYLETGNQRAPTEISNHQWIVCQNPFIMAIWLDPSGTVSDFDESKLCIYLADKLIAEIKLKPIRFIELPKGKLLLVNCLRSQIYHLTGFQRFMMLSYLRLKQKEKEKNNLKNFCASYSYPRKVILVSFQSGDHVNIFPMDFQGFIPETGYYLLGLRKSNQSIGKILEKKQVVICEAPYSKKEIIYQLGKHHHQNPLSIEDFPFAVYESNHFRFPVPEFTASYSEVHLSVIETLGSHVFMAGESINHLKIQEPIQKLNHVHTVHYLHSQPGRT